MKGLPFVVLCSHHNHNYAFHGAVPALQVERPCSTVEGQLPFADAAECSTDLG